jgi:hypothetical protein
MDNTFIGEFTEGMRRSIDAHFKGWIIIREPKNVDEFAGRGLYRAEFGVTRLTGCSIGELNAQADLLPREVNGTIVPTRSIEDVGYPKQYDPPVEDWPENLEYVSRRNRDRLLKALGR